MPHDSPTLQALFQQKLLPLYYHEQEAVSLSLLEALYAAGIRLVEYTARGERALANFSALRRLADARLPGLQLGIGTIKTGQQAQAFIDAGADFIVSPIIQEAVAQAATDAGLLWIPGCMTPTEIARAEAAGAAIVKLFPGSLLGPSYVTAVRELFPGLHFMPTGGVEATADNLRQWFRAGVSAVGMGSKLLTGALIAAGDYDGLRDATANALQLVQAASETAV